MKNSKETFHLEKKYNHSKEYVKEIIISILKPIKTFY